MQSHYSWLQTKEGTFLFLEENEKGVSYSWQGETFDDLIHGQGVLKVFKGDSLADKIATNAYYGAISAQDVISVNDTTKYVGNTKWNKQDGFGVLVQPHNIYVGDFVKSNPHGNLSWYQNGKLRYKGEWKEGRREGMGISYDRDGVYAGAFSNNLYNGEGEKFYKNGLSYDGEWSEGLRSGYGNLYGDEFSYSGNFSKSLPNGEGCLVIGDGIYTYNGNWANGKMSQYGECVYANGDSYEGEWENSSFNGFGVCRYATGDVYEGYWKEGLQEGKGKYIGKNFTYVGDFEGGWINGEGQMNYTNGDWYEGDFYQNKRFGVGCYHFKNGNYYEGEFVNDTINGLGVFHFQDGSWYEGEFEDGKIFGDGTLHIKVNGENISITAFWDGTHNLPTEASVLFENGDLYEGELINGRPTANGIWTTQKERDDGKSFSDKANDFYKEHRDTWNKVVIITSIALTVVELYAPFVGAAIGTIIAGPGGTAAGAMVGEKVSIIAGGFNLALNAADASAAIASASYDVKEAYENGEDPTDAYKTLAMEVGVNVALVVLPKALKKIPFDKVAKKLSKTALGKAAAKMAKKAGKQVSKGASKMAATSAAKAASSITKALKNKAKKGFQKIVQVGKDRLGKVEKRFLNTKVGVKANEIYKSIGKQIKNINKEVAKAKEKELAKKASKESRYLSDKLAKTKISKELDDILAKGPIKLTDKELKDLLEHPEYLRSFYYAKTGSKKGMQEFFIRLSKGDKNQVKKLLENPQIREKVNRTIRQGGGKHEWLMTKNFEDFLVNPKWGDDGAFLALSLTELVQNTESVLFRYGGKHCGVNSGTFHNGLAKVIEGCSSKEELFVEVRKYAKEWLTKESYKEFEGIFKTVFETVM